MKAFYTFYKHYNIFRVSPIIKQMAVVLRDYRLPGPDYNIWEDYSEKLEAV